MEFNEFETTCNQNCFTVNGGHEVTLLSPTQGIITIKCPWPEERVGEEMTLEHRAFVQTRAEAIMAYLLKEGFLSKEGLGINLMVMTKNTKE